MSDIPVIYLELFTMHFGESIIKNKLRFFLAFRMTSRNDHPETLLQKRNPLWADWSPPRHFFDVVFGSGKFLTVLFFFSEIARNWRNVMIHQNCLVNVFILNLVSYLCFTPTCIPHTMPGPPKSFPDVFHYMWWRERPFFREIPYRYFPPGIYGNMCRGKT